MAITSLKETITQEAGDGCGWDAVGALCLGLGGGYLGGFGSQKLIELYSQNNGHFCMYSLFRF